MTIAVICIVVCAALVAVALRSGPAKTERTPKPSVRDQYVVNPSTLLSARMPDVLGRA